MEECKMFNAEKSFALRLMLMLILLAGSIARRRTRRLARSGSIARRLRWRDQRAGDHDLADR